jgi:hypothetical protein
VSDIAALDRFRDFVFGDVRLESALAQIEEPEAFAREAQRAAAAQGIVLADEVLAKALERDPIGLSRSVPVAPSDHWPSREWLPVRIVRSRSGLAVDWAHFAGAPLDDSFFGIPVRRALARPFNALFRWQTPIADFIRAAEQQPAPDGFIFHWSRCGSTLVSRMLQTLPGTLCVSEAEPLDRAVHLGDADLVRAMVAALGRRRQEDDRLFFKWNCWHALALARLGKLFPGTPWIFLYRDPVEILVSHAASPATEMVPDPYWLGIFGLDPASTRSADHEARVLARIAKAAIAADCDGGLYVDYARLPEAVPETILPHFGLACGPAERERMMEATRYDAKRPGQAFAGDSEAKRSGAGEAVVAAAERHLSSHYRAFEALSASRPPASPGLVL